MPMRIAPRTSRAASASATKMPASAIIGGPAVRSPRPIPVAGLFTTIPPSRSPTSVMKSPIPTPIESFIGSGTARTTASRSPARTSTTAISPSITTQAIATCHVTSWASTMSKATIALIPRPEASAIGTFAKTPMQIGRSPRPAPWPPRPPRTASPPPRGSPG